MTKYWAHVVYTYFEAGDFPVEAVDEEEAKALALEVGDERLTEPELLSREVTVTQDDTLEGPCWSY